MVIFWARWRRRLGASVSSIVFAFLKKIIVLHRSRGKRRGEVDVVGLPGMGLSDFCGEQSRC